MGISLSMLTVGEILTGCVPVLWKRARTMSRRGGMLESVCSGGARANASKVTSTGPCRSSVRTIGTRGETNSCRCQAVDPSSPTAIAVLKPEFFPG